MLAHRIVCPQLLARPFGARDNLSDYRVFTFEESLCLFEGRHGAIQYVRQAEQRAHFFFKVAFRPWTRPDDQATRLVVLRTEKPILVGIVERAVSLLVSGLVHAFDDHVTGFIRRHRCDKFTRMKAKSDAERPLR